MNENRLDDYLEHMMAAPDIRWQQRFYNESVAQLRELAA
jgi:hypothetical protein